MPVKINPILIRHLAPKNFLSFGPDYKGIDLLPLNVIIGANGSGKSNLIEAISFMRASLHEWRDVLRRGGGVSEWIWKGNQDDAPASVEWIIQQLPRDKRARPLRHQVAFRSLAQSFQIHEEVVEYQPREKEVKRRTPFYRSIDGAAVALKSEISERRRLAPGTIDMQRSIIGQRNDPEIYPQLAWLASNYKKIRIYREWSMGTKSFLRQPQPSDMRNEVIEEDFSNLGLNLSRLRQNSRAKNAIIQHLRKLDEGLTDFDVSAAGGTVQIFFNEGDFVIPAPRLAYDREFAVDSEQPFSFLIATQPDEETNWGRRLQGEIRREIQTDPPPKFS
ncbi:MAG: hypothetical protein JWM99_4454 [Verrucomicrobiales bacterium]|nr:hypothetical protein [Verrucomicrobiales bacterium]